MSVSAGDLGGWIQSRKDIKKEKDKQGKTKVTMVTKSGVLSVCFKLMQAHKMTEEESHNRYNAFSNDDDEENEMEEEEVAVGGIHHIGRRKRKRA